MKSPKILRNLTSALGTLVLGLASAPAANAAAILQAIEMNGGAITPTSSLVVSAGDTFTLSAEFVDELLDLSSGQEAWLDITWDTGGANTLDLDPFPDQNIDPTNNVFNTMTAIGASARGAVGFVLSQQGDFDGAQTSALRMVSGAAIFPPDTLNGSGGTTIFEVAAGAAPGTYAIAAAFGIPDVAESALPSGDLTNFTYTVVPEPSPALLLGMGLAGLLARRRRA